jgi:hypothetical protein
VKTSKRQYSPAEVRVLLDGIDALGPALPCVDRPMDYSFEVIA